MGGRRESDCSRIQPTCAKSSYIQYLFSRTKRELAVHTCFVRLPQIPRFSHLTPPAWLGSCQRWAWRTFLEEEEEGEGICIQAWTVVVVLGTLRRRGYRGIAGKGCTQRRRQKRKRQA